ncbi:MAG: DUF4861 family protein [Cyclobacteriaceae bacterium]
MNTSKWLLILGVFLSGCPQKELKIRLTNISNETIFKSFVASRDLLKDADQEYFALKGEQLVPSQYDDTDGDGIWDQLVFQYELKPNEVVDIDLVPTELSDLPEFTKKTNVYLGKSENRDEQFVSLEKETLDPTHIAQSTPFLYQFEGPGWESDLVAFRGYFDSRKGKDVFGKKTQDMVADEIGLEENYHEMCPWGMDVLSVGSTLGAGALAILKNDSLIKLSLTKSTSFEILNEGPVRSRFLLTHEGWDVLGEDYKLEETITIWSGTRYYSNDIRLFKNGKPALTDTLVAGIGNKKHVAFSELKYLELAEISYTHGDQSENKDALGLAILTEQDGRFGNRTSPQEGDGIIKTHLTLLKAIDGVYSYSFVAGWEGENEDFSVSKMFQKHLEQCATDLYEQVQLEIIK